MNQDIKIEKPKAKKENSRIGAIIILVISALVFLPFGASAVFQSIFNRQKINSFGSFDGKKIVYEPGSKFYNAVSNLAGAYKNMGYSVDDKTYDSIMNQSFRQTVIDMAFTGAVEKSGYVVPRDAVNREIVKAFTGADGKFSQKAYNQASQADLNSMKNEQIQSLTYSRYVEDFFGTNSDRTLNGKSLYGMKRSSAEKKFLSEMATEKHSFEAASFSTLNFPREQAVIFARNNAEKFIRYNLSVVTVDDESEAKSILKQINGGEITFEDAASEKSQKYYSSADGTLAGSFRYQVENLLDSKDSLSELEQLKTGSISSVIKTAKGYSIFKCNGDVEAADFSDEKTQGAILSYMNSSEKGYIENYYMEMAENFVSETAVSDFDEACRKFSVEKSVISPFAINYGNVSILPETEKSSSFSRLSNNEEAYRTAFALKTGEVSAPFVLGSSVVVLKCTQIEKTPAEEIAEPDIASLDSSSLQAELFASDKLENNFWATYLKLAAENKKKE